MGQLGGLSPEGSVAIGIIVGLLSTSVQSIGLTLQRKSHILEDEKDVQDTRRPPYRRRRWQIGMGMFVIANLLGSTIQITTLPLPVLSTLQASGLVFNSICATLLLGEPFTRWSFGGTVLVCSGAVLIAIYGAIPEPAHNLDQLLFLLGRRPFILWMIGQAVLVIAVIILATCLARVPSMSSNPRVRLFRGLAYGSISGILSAHSLLVAKSAVELLVRTIVDGVNQFNRWQSWMSLLGLIFLALTQLYYLHQGLKLVSTSVLYPLVFCIYNIIAILDGLIYFRQTDSLPVLHACLIGVGTVILLSGVLALSWRLSDEQSQPATAVAHSALAPGLGFVEDTDNEDYDDSSTLDEEAALGAEDQALLNNEPMTPTTKLDTVLGATRIVRNPKRSRGSDVPRNELEADYDTKLKPPRRSRVSLQLPPAHRDVEGLESDADDEHAADESTSLLPRTPSQRRKRRKSTGFPGFVARPERSHSRPPPPQSTLSRIFDVGWWRGARNDASTHEEGPSTVTGPNTDASTAVHERNDGHHDDEVV